MTDQVNEAVAWIVPSARATPDGSWEDGPDSLVLESEATDYIRRIGTPLYTHPARGVVSDAMVDLAMDADALEYGASIPASRVRRILEAAALQAAQPAVPSVPEDCVPVPVVPTEEMLRHFWHVCNGASEWLAAPMVLTKKQMARARKAYFAMLAATPKGQPAQENDHE